MRHFKYLVPILVISAIFFFQNCSGIHLSPTSNQSVQCALPEDIDRYSVSFYQQSADQNTASFQVVDSQGIATNISADWNDGQARGNHIILDEDFSHDAQCTTRTITATFTILSNPADPTSPALTRQLTSDIFKRWDPVRRDVDVTQFTSIWGGWPGYPYTLLFGNNGYQDSAYGDFNRYGYMAWHFRTGATVPNGPNGQPKTQGYFSHVTFGGPRIDMSISTTCGQFTNLPAGCLKIGSYPDDNAIVRWLWSGNGGNNFCVLSPNTDYYVNIKLTDPAHDVQNCPLRYSVCPVAIINY